MLPDKDWLTTKDIADYLGFHPRTIQVWILENKLPAVKVGREYRIKRADLEKFLEEHRIRKK